MQGGLPVDLRSSSGKMLASCIVQIWEQLLPGPEFVIGLERATSERLGPGAFGSPKVGTPGPVMGSYTRARATVPSIVLGACTGNALG
jgi:hypothetical protein